MYRFGAVSAVVSAWRQALYLALDYISDAVPGVSAAISVLSQLRFRYCFRVIVCDAASVLLNGFKIACF